MHSDNDIAIVGVGCRFPGADNLEEYWELLVNGENHVSEITKERWNHEAFYSENKDESGKYYVKRAGFLKRHDDWDHQLFGVSESEAVRIDPQQRYVLECTHMAMEDGGITRSDMKGSQTGVYIGVMNDDYKICVNADFNDSTNYSATGMSTTIIASRVSYTYDLQGPCMVIDTACSSSMTALHLGSQAILNGDCEMAICGGVSSILSPGVFVTLCRARMMSALGQCQAFCDTADGYARGEGCGVVILKKFRKAIDDGNKIWAVLYTGINQDGHATSPITAPSGDQQVALLQHIYSKYGIDPTSLQYIEAHGTGTPIGDPVEINAIGKFITTFNKKKLERSHFINHEQYNDTILINEHCEITKSIQEKNCDEFPVNNMNKSHLEPFIRSECILIGSVKTNIGHTESAAGVASLIKVLLMMKNGKYVPSLHVKHDKSNINKNIHLQNYDLDIALRVKDWGKNENGERIGCINSFGFGGSNGHAIVIQKAVPFTILQKTEPLSICGKIDNNTDHSPNHIIFLSAVDKTALIETIKLFRKSIAKNEYSLRDVAYTSALKRDHFRHRTFVFGKRTEEITQNIDLKLKHEEQIMEYCNLKVIFVFCGVGTTWTGMGMEMMRTQSVFKAKIKEIDVYLKPLTGWCMADRLENETNYNDPFLCHVSIFCIQVALFALWQHFGVTPDIMVGQSVGEVAAAVASGSISLRDGVLVIYHRSKILANRTGGKMMVVGNLPIAKIEDLCAEYNNKVSIAVYNSPTSCTLSGDSDIIEEIKSKLEILNKTENAGILLSPLSVQLAYHSEYVQPCMNEIAENLSFLTKGSRVIDMISTVTGELATLDELHTGHYWAENVRKPVRFMQSLIRATHNNATNVFVELGPRPVLKAHVQNIMGMTLKGISLPSLRYKDENKCFLTSLNVLYEMGLPLSFESIIRSDFSREPIPLYNFNKKRLLFIPEKELKRFSGYESSETGHMYVTRGKRQTSFKLELCKKTTPFVYDHTLENVILVPGSTYIEAAFEIGNIFSESNVYELDISAEFKNSFAPPDEDKYVLDANLYDVHNNEGVYEISKDGRIICQGTIKKSCRHNVERVDLGLLREGCTHHRTQSESYKCLEDIEFRYDNSLRLIQQSWTSENECIAELTMPYIVKQQIKRTHLHPCILDAMFQTFGIVNAFSENTRKSMQIPKSVGSVILKCPPQGKMICYSKKVSSSARGNRYNCILLSNNGNVIAEVQNFYTQSVLSSDEVRHLTYSLNWNDIELDYLNVEQARIKTLKSESNKTLIFGSARFISAFKQIKGEENDIFVELDFSMKNVQHVFSSTLKRYQNPKSVTFAPCYHMQYSKDINEINLYDVTLSNFMTLSFLVSVLNEYNCKMPLIVVTENTIVIENTVSSKANVCGAELWGMVRSAIAEMVYCDIRVVDIVLNDQNMRYYRLLSQTLMPDFKEYQIKNGKLYTSELVIVEDQDNQIHREITTTGTENVTLHSSKSTEILNPSFSFKTVRNVTHLITPAPMVNIRIHRVALHDSAVYPITTEINESQLEIWPNSFNKRFGVISLEGIGVPEDTLLINGKKIQSRDVVGYCFPVNVASTISIPNTCVFLLKDFPFYKPGMLTSSVLLWNLIESCIKSNSKQIVVIVEDNINERHPLLIQMFLRLKESSIKFITLRCLDTIETNEIIKIDTVVVLSKLTHSNVKYFLKFQKCCKIISTRECCPYHIQGWLIHNMSSNSFEFLDSVTMFAPSTLSKLLPDILKWFQSLNASFWSDLKVYIEQFDSNTLDPNLNMFRNTLSLNESDIDFKPIPLKVDTAHVFRKDCCYVLVGGLTGLGWELMKYMAELGAGYLATFSRRTPDAQKLINIKEIEKTYSCKIIPIQVDITDLKSLFLAVNKLQTRIGGVYIKGIFHGGGVTSDALLNKTTIEKLEMTIKPKILGTWNLHLATKHLKLDFFVMHSSIVSVLGNVGQCNYAAGNSFQDSFAYYRRSLGLCGQSINWSTLSVGMVKKDKAIEKALQSQGFNLLSVVDIRKCFIRAIMEDPPQIAFGQFNWNQLAHNPTVKSFKHKFNNVLKNNISIEQYIPNNNSQYHFDIQTFRTYDSEKQILMIYEHLIKVITGTILVDRSLLSDDVRIITIGIDSMSAMSLANVLYESMHVRVPIMTLLSDSTTIHSLTIFIYDNYNQNTSNPELSKPEKQWAILEGNITFMQRDLLTDYIENPDSMNFIRQADFEIRGINLQLQDWKDIINNLLHNHSELRRVYRIDKENSSIDSVLLSRDEVDIDIEMVAFDSICNKDSNDDRQNNIFNLSTEIPIKFKLALKSDSARFRMYIHSVISDLKSIAIIFDDVRLYTNAVILKQALPKTDINIVPAECLRKSLAPRMDNMKHFWKDQLSRDIQPLTFTDNIDRILDESKWSQVVLRLSQELVDTILRYVSKTGNTLYTFVMSVYLAFLYALKGNNYIPLLTNVDMRGHVSDLSNVVTRCINSIPVIGDFRTLSTVKEYMQSTKDHLSKLTENSGYPYKLIEEEILTDTLRKNIGRHRLVMDDMTKMNAILRDTHTNVKLQNIYHKRHVYETSLYISYDLHDKNISLEYSFNTEAIKPEFATQYPNTLALLMKYFIEKETHPILNILTALTKERCLHHTFIEIDKQVQNKTFLERTQHNKQNVILCKIQALDKPLVKKAVTCRDVVILQEGMFQKQTRRGWDHQVYAEMEKHRNGDNNCLVLRWGLPARERRKCISLDKVSEVHVKRINEIYGLMFKMPNRWFVLKTKSRLQAITWFDTFQYESRNMQINEHTIHL